MCIVYYEMLDCADFSRDCSYEGSVGAERGLCILLKLLYFSCWLAGYHVIFWFSPLAYTLVHVLTMNSE